MHTFATLLCVLAFISTASGINATPKRIPLYFEANAGQAYPDVRFIARNGDLTALIKRNETVVILPGADPIHIRLAGSRAAETVTGLEKTGAITSYFSGDDRSKWRTGIPHYSKVRASAVYPGIDVIYHANEGQLEYDFVIAPGADPSRIELIYEGAKGIEIDKNGDLKITTSGQPLLQRKPVAYQEISGRRVEVAIRYVVKPNRQVSFALNSYDRAKPLIIDPVLIFHSTQLTAGSMAVDSSGALYLMDPNRRDWPAQTSTQFGSPASATIAKLNPAGDALVYVVHFGGGAAAIAVDAQGCAYLTGGASQTEFPTVSPMRGYSGNGDAFVTKLNPSGTALVYSTFLGGSAADSGRSIAVDSTGAVYVAGISESLDFPLVSAFAPPRSVTHAFMSKINPAGSALAYSTFVLRSDEPEITHLYPSDSYPESVAVDSAGAAYVTGSVFSSAPGSPQQVFVAKLSPSGSSRGYLTGYPGFGLSAKANGIGVDPSGAVIVAGTFYSSPSQVFAFKLHPNGAFAYVKRFGGTYHDYGNAIAVDRDGFAYIAGFTESADFPLVNALMPVGEYAPTLGQAFTVKLDRDGNTVWSTALPANHSFAIAVDPAKNVAVAGSGGFGTPGYMLVKLAEATAGLVALTTNPPGLDITVDGVTMPSPRQFQWVPGSSHTISAAPTLPVNPQTRMRFIGWTGGVPTPASLAQTITTPANSVTYVANFQLQHRLSIEALPATGGTVRAEPPSPDGFYDDPSLVNIQVTPAPGFTFTGFSGAVAGTLNPGFVRMSAPRVVSANVVSSAAKVGTFRSGHWFFDRNENGAWDHGVDQDSTFGQPNGIPISGDWNGDGRSKFGTFQNGSWSLDVRGDGAVSRTFNYGSAGDLPVAGDWTGAGNRATRPGLFRNGQWRLDLNGNLTDDDGVFHFGIAGDLPVGGDWNRSGTTKIAVFRSGQWFFDMNGNRAWDGPNLDRAYANFGMAGDLPVTGDWTGTGALRIGVYRRGRWFLDINGNGQWDGPLVDRQFDFGAPSDTPVVGFIESRALTAVSKVGKFRDGTWSFDVDDDGALQTSSPDRILGVFGGSGDIPFMGDWDGTGTLRIGVYRSLDNVWYLDINGNGSWDRTIDRYISNYHSAGGLPVVGDWDGNGVTRVGVFSNGIWVLDVNNDGVLGGPGDRFISNFGIAGDLPVAGDWIGGTRISRIGVYRRGTWFFDMNDNGVWDNGDRTQVLGTSSHLPVVGHWYGSPAARIGIFREGVFALDTGVAVEGTTRVITLGTAGDVPIAGAWSTQ